MNIGDKIVCIRIDKVFDALTIGKEYRIIDIDEETAMYSSNGIYLSIKNDNGVENYYYHSKFIGVREYRKRKGLVRYEGNMCKYKAL